MVSTVTNCNVMTTSVSSRQTHRTRSSGSRNTLAGSREILFLLSFRTSRVLEMLSKQPASRVTSLLLLKFLWDREAEQMGSGRPRSVCLSSTPAGLNPVAQSLHHPVRLNQRAKQTGHTGFTFIRTRARVRVRVGFGLGLGLGSGLGLQSGLGSGQDLV